MTAAESSGSCGPLGEAPKPMHDKDEFDLRIGSARSRELVNNVKSQFVIESSCSAKLIMARAQNFGGSELVR